MELAEEERVILLKTTEEALTGSENDSLSAPELASNSTNDTKDGLPVSTV